MTHTHIAFGLAGFCLSGAVYFAWRWWLSGWSRADSGVWFMVDRDREELDRSVIALVGAVCNAILGLVMAHGW